MKKIFLARDDIGWGAQMRNFQEIYSTVCMTCTFAVGVDIENRNRVGIFYVTNDGIRDHYEMKASVNINPAGGISPEIMGRMVQNELKDVMRITIKRVLTTRLKSGMITIEQIEKIAKYEKEKK